ncbi:hypothetical protein FKM82_015276 [Ascaphus truei]
MGNYISNIPLPGARSIFFNIYLPTYINCINTMEEISMHCISRYFKRKTTIKGQLETHSKHVLTALYQLWHINSIHIYVSEM